MAKFDQNKRNRFKFRPTGFETLEDRKLLAGDSPWHNGALPTDVNADKVVTPVDALVVINELNRTGARDLALDSASGESSNLLDVSNDGWLQPLDALLVINRLNAEGETAAELALRDPSFNARLLANLNSSEALGSQNLLTAGDVKTLLKRASQASPSNDAIIAVVDRTGRILGVRVEDGVSATLKNDPAKLAFAIDGAVAKARTAAFFSSNEAPLPSRTIRFISQSTITQREVESSPNNTDQNYRGPGFVAPIGVGGHFPPEVPFTPQVDLFNIEHQSRDRKLLSLGNDGTAGSADDVSLRFRFNVNPLDIAQDASGSKDIVTKFLQAWPESYGVQAGTNPAALARGIATLPGGVPLYKIVTDAAGRPLPLTGNPQLPPVNLVGGIGVFFPGPDGFATHEQGFQPRVGQSEAQRTNASRVLEAEFIALAASAGADAPNLGVFGIAGANEFRRNFREFNTRLEPAPLFVQLNGRIDLVGITLEIFGPTPTTNSPIPGIDRLIQVGRSLGTLGTESGSDVKVLNDGTTYLAGQAVPEGWLVVPHDASDGSITGEEVEQIILRGINQANQTRAAIRLNVANNFRPGAKTRMVLSVADKSGNLLGVFRMPDATIFSIDVSIAKARNTAYYADAEDLQAADRVDFNHDNQFGTITNSLTGNGDSLPLGTALTNRTFRFLAEPRFPTGIELASNAANGLVNDASKTLAQQNPGLAQLIGPQSILQLPGINPKTGENLGQPLPFSVYADPNSDSTAAFDSFVPARNFRDPGDIGVKISGTDTLFAQANQNGVVFFPGSTPLYKNRALTGGFGVSGDGVDQDDVVTAAGQSGFTPEAAIRVDSFAVGNVRLPFQKYNRNPEGA